MLLRFIYAHMEAALLEEHMGRVVNVWRAQEKPQQMGTVELGKAP